MQTQHAQDASHTHFHTEALEFSSLDTTPARTGLCEPPVYMGDQEMYFHNLQNVLIFKNKTKYQVK